MLYPLQCPAQLVGARCAFCTATYAVEALDDIVNMLPTHQRADALQVSVAASKKEHLLDDVVLISSHVDELRAGAPRFILYMLCTHTST